MEFIGEDGIPAKLLKDSVGAITKISKWISFYIEVIKHMRKGFYRKLFRLRYFIIEQNTKSYKEQCIKFVDWFMAIYPNSIFFYIKACFIL